MKTSSFRSPKNKYMLRINYSKVLNGIGSGTILTGNDISELKSLAKHYIDQAHRNGATCNIILSENKQTYPSFDWHELERYTA